MALSDSGTSVGERPTTRQALCFDAELFGEAPLCLPASVTLRSTLKRLNWYASPYGDLP